MKKVKVMLVSIGVLAVVGGALAFNAAKFTTKFCTAPQNDASGKCPNGLVSSSTSGTGTIYKYVLTSNTSNCASAKPACNSTTTFIDE